jgi:hypothetical protein
VYISTPRPPLSVRSKHRHAGWHDSHGACQLNLPFQHPVHTWTPCTHPWASSPRRARPAPGIAATTPPPAWAGGRPGHRSYLQPRLRRRHGSSPAGAARPRQAAHTSSTSGGEQGRHALRRPPPPPSWCPPPAGVARPPTAARPFSVIGGEQGRHALRRPPPPPDLSKPTCAHADRAAGVPPHTMVALGRHGVVGVGTLPSGYVIKVVQAGLLSPSPPPHGVESRRVLVPMARSSLSRRAGLELGGGGRSRGAGPPQAAGRHTHQLGAALPRAPDSATTPLPESSRFLDGGEHGGKDGTLYAVTSCGLYFSPDTTAGRDSDSAWVAVPPRAPDSDRPP